MPSATLPPTDAPPPDPPTTRERIVYSGAELFRRQGYAGTGIKHIAAHADATLGSVYHFFPGGKDQLADEVLRTGGSFFLALYEAFAAAALDLPSAVRDFFAGAAETLQNTGYADACPIATVAGDIASTNPLLRETTAQVFESWLGALAEDAVEAGIPAERARPLALSVLALLEGAFLLSRSLRSVEPMFACGAAAVGLLEDAIAEART
ncbi:MAG TPA: TetR/AcrR family transcriptional regulator [Solirubrobacteraceae bacterium]|nr:TetR/AcrR family transcriptional regulator [Solirubrobacteraceae bacterium]